MTTALQGLGMLAAFAALLLIVFYATIPPPSPSQPSPPSPTAVEQLPPPPPPPQQLGPAQIHPLLIDPATAIWLPIEWHGPRPGGFIVERVALGSNETRPAPDARPDDVLYLGADVNPIMARHPWGATLIIVFEEGQWREAGGGAPALRVVELRGSGGIPSGVRNQSLLGSTEGIRLRPTHPEARLRHARLAWSTDHATVLVIADQFVGEATSTIAWERHLREHQPMWHGPRRPAYDLMPTRWGTVCPLTPRLLSNGSSTLLDMSSIDPMVGVRIVGTAEPDLINPNQLRPEPHTCGLILSDSHDRTHIIGQHWAPDGSRTRLLKARTCQVLEAGSPCYATTVSPECAPSDQWPGIACVRASAALDRVAVARRDGTFHWVDEGAVQSIIRAAAFNRADVLAVVYDAIVGEHDGPMMATRVAFFETSPTWTRLGHVELQRGVRFDIWPWVNGGHWGGSHYAVTTPGPNDDDTFVVVFPRIDPDGYITDAIGGAGAVDRARRSLMELVRIRL